MNINTVIALLLSVAILVDSDHYWDTKRQFCGSILAEELKVLCKGLYNEPKSRLRKRGIVQECCNKICSRKFLKENYCPSVKPDEVKLPAKVPITSHSKKVEFLTNYFEQTWNLLSYLLRKH